MLEIKKPKIGIVSLGASPLPKGLESLIAADRRALEELSEKFRFDLKVIEPGINDQAKAKRAASELAGWGADFILIQTASTASSDLVFAFTELPARLGLWAVPEDSAGSRDLTPIKSFAAANMYNSVIRLQLKEYPRPVKWFYGRAKSFEFVERFGVTVAALRVLVNLEGTRIGLIGGVTAGFDNLAADAELFREKLGVEILEFSIDRIVSGAEKVNDSLASRTAREIRSGAAAFDHSQSKALEKTARVYQSVTALAEENNLKGVAINCRPQFQQDYGLAVCSVVGHLNTNGTIAACEGDAASAVSMLLLHWLTNGDPVTLLDLVSIDHADQSVLLWKCGPTSPKMADERGMRLQSLRFPDGSTNGPVGLHNDLVLKAGLGTVLGLMPDLKKCLVLEGGIDPHKAGFTGSRGWLKNLHLNMEPVTIQDLMQTLMSSGFQHHYPFAYGSQSAAALELCAWLNIEPIQKQAYTAYLMGHQSGD